MMLVGKQSNSLRSILFDKLKLGKHLATISKTNIHEKKMPQAFMLVDAVVQEFYRG